MLAHVKPILRKHTIHCSKNVMLIFKSIEVQIHEEIWNKDSCKPTYKFVEPVYVPFSRLSNYMGLDKAQIEMAVLKSLHLRQGSDTNKKDSFIYLDSHDLQDINKLQGTNYRSRTQAQKLLGSTNKVAAKTYGKKQKMSRLGSQMKLRLSPTRDNESPMRDADPPMSATGQAHPLITSAGK